MDNVRTRTLCTFAQSIQMNSVAELLYSGGPFLPPKENGDWVNFQL